MNFPKAARANFSHALGAKVKKIIRKNLATRELAEVWTGFSDQRFAVAKDDVN